MVDDHSCLAYPEIMPDEQGPTCAAFLLRAVEYLAVYGIAHVERVTTDNRWSYRRSAGCHQPDGRVQLGVVP